MQTAPHGTWPSPLSAATLARGSLRYGFSSFGASGALYWSEQRAAEQGRSALVRLTADGRSEELLPAPYSARTRVYEYGGRSFLVSADETRVWFVNASDQQLHERGPDGAIRQLTHAPELRFAELQHDAKRDRLLALVERHAAEHEVEHFIAAVPLATGEVQRLVSGRDFYAGLALSPDGSQLAYLAWSHPHLPWDAAELHVCELDTRGEPGPGRHVAGSPEASALQPTWSADGQLYFAAEISGRWALQRSTAAGEPQPVAASLSGEVGAPLWQLGAHLWGFLADGSLAAVSFERGESALWHVDPARGAARLLSRDYPYIGQLCTHASELVLSVGWAGAGSELVRFDVASGRATSLRCAHAGLLAPEDTSQAEPIAFQTSHGETAHGFFYAPRNSACQAPAGSLPPLVVLVHGGPTAGAAATWSATVQYFTTRGFAVLDVNYRGSTGFGRAYRDRLRGEWGVLDVDDCVAGARHLAEQGRVDRARLVIRGGSAGGYSVLQALAMHDVFAAGSCHYGVSDLEALARDTHKFELHYLDGLVGPYPEERARFAERSPIHYVERIHKPVIFFQGLEDKVVPAAQTERMAEVLRARGVDVEYHAYAGEQHGFRKAETIEHMLRTELEFLQRVLGLAR